MKDLIIYIVEKSIILFSYLQKSKISIMGLIHFLCSKIPRQYVFTKIYPRKFDKQKIERIEGYTDVGIVFQGPYVVDERFTLNTILLFRSIYPNIHIVLSTWENSIPEDDRELLDDLHCHVIESKSLPSEEMGKYRKVGHLNSQIYSAQKGLQYLKAISVSYALKIRTDLRIHMREFIPYFINLLNLYKCGTSKLNKRLLCVSFSNNLVYCPFHMSDFIWFGSLEDMVKLYSIPGRTINMKLNNLINDKPYITNQAQIFKTLMSKPYERTNFHQEVISTIDREFYYFYHEEAYIVRSYYESLFSPSVETDIKDYWDFVRNCLVVIDDSMLDVYWTKYGYTFSQKGKIENQGLLTHAVWLDMLSNDNDSQFC